ncbi:MAG: carboxymuconolactone decarboxylase family protein [Candidatus Binataceae bacterium]
MSLVPYADIAKLPEDVRTALAQAPVQLNIFKMMANAETCFIPFTRLGGAILSRQKLDGKLREMAILMAVKIEGGEYEWIQHVPIAISVGATQAQVDAISNRQVDAACFTDLERAALRFTEQVVNNVRAEDATVREVMKFLSPREVVELIMTIGFYMMAARITETTRTDLDPPAGTKVIDQLKREG